MTEAIAERYGVDLDVPWEDLPEEERELFLTGTDERLAITYRNRFGRTRKYATKFEGIVKGLERRYRESESELTKEKIEQFMSLRPCPVCGGARLRAESRAVLVAGTAIDEFCALSARRALEWLQEVELSETDRHIARLILREIDERLRFLENVGIGYLSMDRAAATLSGGEAQRIRLATQIGSSLVGVLYILDEPSIGLHQRDNSKLIGTLERLRDLGNTVIVVEHDEQTMRAADYLVDMGPGAGVHGGRIVAQGTAKQVERVKDSATGQFLAGTRTIAAPTKRRTPTGYVEIEGATQHNLSDVDVKVPLGVLTCVTGVSGSGKSTLVNEVLYKSVASRLHRARRRPGAHRAIHGLDQLDKIIAVDQSPIGRTPRSNPATYTGLFDVIRDMFSKTQEARARGYKAGQVQLQREGRALRGVQGRRADQDRDALPARRVRALRAVPRQALQPRDARGEVQGQEHRRRARHGDRGRAAILRAHPEGAPPAGDAERRRARLRQARPARDDALGRRGAAREARDRAVEGRDRAGRCTSSTSRRRGCTSPTSSGCWRCCSGSSTRATAWS